MADWFILESIVKLTLPYMQTLMKFTKSLKPQCLM